MIEVKNKISSQELLKVSKFKEEIRRTKPHKHDSYYELIFLSRGQGVHWIDTEKLKVEPPIVFALKPGQLHCWELTDIPSGYVLMIKEAYFDAPERATVKRLFQEITTTSKYSLVGVDQEVLQILENLEVELKNPRRYSDNIIESYLQVVASKVLQNAGVEKDEKKSQVDQTFARFNILLRSKIPECTKVKQFASLLNTTPQNLNHICRKITAQSASGLIREEILLEAKRYLIHTDKTILQLSGLLNFKDASHFIKFFKKYNQVTPHKFRDKYFQ